MSALADRREGLAPRGGADPFRVVVVDDVDWVRSMLAELLDEVDGIEVCATASDGDEAVDVVLAERPDAVLMDLKMPRVDGITAAKQILATWPEAKIVLNSAYGDHALVEAAMAAGVAGYVTKDRRPAELITTLLELRPGPRTR
jgi:DNA-binding NarL/FixJ family response regulator